MQTQLKSPQLILTVGIGPGKVEDQVRLEFGQGLIERLLERRKILIVFCAILEVDIEGAGRLGVRIIPLLMKR